MVVGSLVIIVTFESMSGKYSLETEVELERLLIAEPRK